MFFEVYQAYLNEGDQQEKSKWLEKLAIFKPYIPESEWAKAYKEYGQELTKIHQAVKAVSEAQYSTRTFGGSELEDEFGDVVITTEGKIAINDETGGHSSIGTLLGSSIRTTPASGARGGFGARGGGFGDRSGSSNRGSFGGRGGGSSYIATSMARNSALQNETLSNTANRNPIPMPSFDTQSAQRRDFSSARGGSAVQRGGRSQNVPPLPIPQ